MSDFRSSEKAGHTPGREPAATVRPASEIPAQDRLRAKEIAALEDCSISTAGDLIRSGKLGPIYGRNRRNRWIDRANYQAFLDRAPAK